MTSFLHEGRRLFRWALLTSLVVGVVLRVIRYAADRSLWGDEGALALNIVQRSPGDLLEPLDYVQGAPTAFLLAEKAATYVFGEAELALRLVPLLCGLAALGLLAVVARRTLRPEAAVLAVALTALSEPLVYYSSEVKQYETDVVAGLLLLYAAVAVDWRRVSLASGVALAAGGVVVVWFSHAALIVLPSLLAVLVASAALRRDRAALRALIPLAAVLAVSTLASFAVNQKNTERVAAGALHSTGSSGQGITEPVKNAWDAYSSVVGVAASVTALAVVLALAGFVVLVRRNPTHAALVVAPIIATFLASVAGQYPFSGRFILFLAPALILLAAEGAVAMVDALPSVLFPVGVAAVVLVLLYPLGISIGNAVDPPGHEEVKSVLRTVERNWRPGDAVYVWWQSQYPFRYYAECADCGVLSPTGPASVIWPPDSRDLPNGYALETHEPDLYVAERSHDLDNYARGLDRLDGRSRVWFVFSSTWDDEFVRRTLDCLGRPLREARATRAVAYLYDLAAAPAATVCPG